MSDPSAQPIVRIAELEIDPDQMDRYRAMLAEEIEASVATEPGVLTLHAVAPRDRPGQVILLEIYVDQAAYEAHLRSPHFVRYKTLTAAMVLSLRLVEADPICLRVKAGFAA